LPAAVDTQWNVSQQKAVLFSQDGNQLISFCKEEINLQTGREPTDHRQELLEPDSSDNKCSQIPKLLYF
jgi:hypothetical protein